MKRDPKHLSLAEHQALAAKLRLIQRLIGEVYHVAMATWGLAHPATKALERIYLTGRNPLDRIRGRLDDAFCLDAAFREESSPYFGDHIPAPVVAAMAAQAKNLEDPCVNVP